MKNNKIGLNAPIMGKHEGKDAIAYQYYDQKNGMAMTKYLQRSTFDQLNQAVFNFPPLIRTEGSSDNNKFCFVQFWTTNQNIGKERYGCFNGYEDFDSISWEIKEVDPNQISYLFLDLTNNHNFSLLFPEDQEMTNNIYNHYLSQQQPPLQQEENLQIRSTGLISKLNSDYSLGDSLSLEELERVIKESEVAYYNSLDDPNQEEILDDAVYDYLKELYRSKLIEAGKTPNSGDGMEHVPRPTGRLLKLPIWLGGMNKFNHGSGQLSLWTKKYLGPYMISAKMDGASALLFREDGQVKLYSRGKNGKAQNISELLSYLNLPVLPDGFMIRGELIMKKSVFAQKYKRRDLNSKDGYRNIRNAVAGLVNKTGSRAAGSKNSDQPLDAPFIKDLEFIAYEVVTNPPMKASDQYNYLDSNYGSQVAPHVLLEQVNDEIMSQALDYYLNVMDYEIDGMIICDNNVHERPYGTNFPYIAAYKKPLKNLLAITTVRSIEWNPSKDRLLKPVLIIDPVEIDGTTTQRATVYNARWVINKNLGPGAVVEVTRSGGVIPKVLRAIESAPGGPSLPTKYKYFWDKNEVELILDDDDINSEANREVVIKKLYHFLKTIEAKGIGKENVGKVYDIGVRTIPNLLQLTQEHVAFMGPKASQNFIDIIKRHVNNIPLPILAKASGVFGRGFGKSLMTKVFETYPNILESQEVQTNNIPAIIKMIEVLPDFAELRADQIAAGFYKFLGFLQEMYNVGYQINSLRYEPPKATVTQTGHPLAGINIAFTGFTKAKDDGISAFVESVGGTIQDRLKSDTKLLIVKDINSNSSKAKTAREKGIPIMSKEEFMAQYMS